MARLVVDSGPDKGMVYPLSAGSITAGRSPNNAIQIIDKRTSRHHAEFRTHSGNISVRDLDSKNGTYVNDQKLDKEHRLHSGDKVLIGETMLMFERDPSEAKFDDQTSQSVRLVADLAWGHEKGTMEAGAGPEKNQLRPDETNEGRAPKEAADRLRVLLKVSDALRTCHDEEPLLAAVMEAIVTLLQPDRACILLKDDENGELLSRCVHREDAGEKNSDEIVISQTILDRCLKDKISLLVEDALSDARFKASESIVIQQIKTAMCAPMFYQDTVLGIIYLDVNSRRAAYGQADLEMATGLANQTAIGLTNIRLEEQIIEQRTDEREMEIAKDIQMRLLPRKMPHIPPYEVSAMSLPAKKVGGDYYDLIEFEDGRLGVAIADVSGKGVPAAILIASVRAALQGQCLRDSASVGEILEQLNAMVYRDTANNMFVTMIYAVLNTKNGIIEYANAGHPFPLLFTPKGDMTELESNGTFLGITERVDYVRGHASLKPGHTLILYSDGVTDTVSPKGDLYGRNRLVEIIRANLGSSAREMREAIFQDTQKFRGVAEQFDDFTLVVLRNSAEDESAKKDEGPAGERALPKQA